MRRCLTTVAAVLATAVLSSCTLYGWGSNYRNQLGDGTTYDRHQPAAAAKNPGWATVSVGESSACGIDVDKHLSCWGTNGGLGIGDGTTQPRAVPTTIGGDADWTSVDVGAGAVHGPLDPDPGSGGPGYDTSSACGIRADGALYCWGNNFEGQLGDASRTDRLAPTRVGTATNWTSVEVGSSHTCGLRGPGALYCWGSNGYGQRGDGTSSLRLTPKRIGSFTDWTSVDAGITETCAIRGAGDLYCWGVNNSISNPVVGGPFPTRVGTATGWTSVDINGYGGGGSATCGIQAGELWCWGHNGFGQLGDATSTDRPVPTRIGADADWTTVSRGGSHTCGIRAGGGLYCWGSNAFGSLGDGTETNRLTPTRIGPASDWTDVSTGTSFTMGIRAS